MASDHREKGAARLWVAGVLSILLLAQPGLASAWESVLGGENLRVERRPYAGSALDEIRGVTRVRSSLNALMALLKDARYNRQWVYRSGGATILQENGYGQAYVYGVVDAPWPMSDRDTIVRFDYHQDSSTKNITITISNVPSFAGEEPGLIRVPDFGGFWKLNPQQDGWVEVIYQVYGDPGGYVPVWLANYAAAVSVIRTLQNLPEAVTRYADARSEWVDEPPPG